MHRLKQLFWLLKAFLANLVYGFPSRKLTLIGVTGTDGKTTTTSMIAHCLKESGEKVDYVSSVGATIGGVLSPIGFHVTTPRFFALQHFFRRSVNAGTKYFVLEVTSHAIDQLRVWGCHFKIVALTNITSEHLDYHRSFERYAKTKLSLVNRADLAVINVDAPTYYRYKSLIKNTHVWYTGVTKKADLNFSSLEKLGLCKNFNCFEKENAVLAFQVGRVLGIKPKPLVAALNSFKRVNGRFDYFEAGGRRFLVDFAHTPNSFVQLFKAVKTEFKVNRIIHVFGCAGERDVSKRAKMGNISAQNAEVIVLTEEDYRTEPIMRIFSQIEEGVKKIKTHKKDQTYFFEPDRKRAIEKAFELSTSRDLIVLTGKAHEKSLARGRKEYPWDEYLVVEEVTAQNVQP
jgi:UDP-N-acetylmuramoyl-L-alanyl-D-glutamate--2,6-diaminopimelate ligase